MSSFWELTQFEYKKIFRKKSTPIVLIITLFLTILSCCAVLLGNYYVDGVLTESMVQAMRTDRAYSRALAGRPIDSRLLLEMSRAYANVPLDGGKYADTPEFNLYARPYSGIYGIARSVYYSSTDPFGVAEAQMLTNGQAESFYQIRAKKVAETVSSMFASDETKAYLLELDSRVDSPFIYDYAEGYTRFFSIMYSTGMLACFVAAILLAPLFSGEYFSGADQLILSSKHGKSKLISAKLFTGFTLSGGLCLILIALTYIQCMLTYGFDGGNAAIQLRLPLSVYPLTMGKTAFLFSVCIVIGTLLTAAVTMLLSAKMKAPFGVIILIMILMIAPMFLNDPEKSALVSNLLCLLPTNMMNLGNVISPHLFEIGRMAAKPYLVMPIFAGVVSLILLPFTYFKFKNHQAG